MTTKPIALSALDDSTENVEKPLRLTEIFCSLQGESNTIGWPTVFVRLTGCPLRCVYCDTAYAFTGGERWARTDILNEVARHGARHVCMTGGEPLAQSGVHDLLEQLCDAGYSVSLETSGALDVSRVDRRVHIVMDLKTPASGELDRNHWDNLNYLKSSDEIKFVLANRDDFEWMESVVGDHQLDQRCAVICSPVADQLTPKDLAEWVIASPHHLRMQLQLHKIIWGDEPGH